jgi:hypothetical protein
VSLDLPQPFRVRNTRFVLDVGAPAMPRGLASLGLPRARFSSMMQGAPRPTTSIASSETRDA